MNTLKYEYNYMNVLQKIKCNNNILKVVYLLFNFSDLLSKLK